MAPTMDDNPSANPNHPESSESEYDVLDKNNSEAGSFMSTPAEAEMDSSDDKKLTISKVSVVEVPPSPNTENATQAMSPPESKPLLDISDSESIIRAAKLIATFANEIERLGGLKFLEDLEKLRNNQTPPKSISPDSEKSKAQQASGNQFDDVQQASTATDETVAKHDQDVNRKTDEASTKDQVVEGASPGKEKAFPEESPAKDDATPEQTTKSPPTQEEAPPKAASDPTEETKGQDSSQNAEATKEISAEDVKEDAANQEGIKEGVTPESQDKKKDESQKEESKAEVKEEPKDGEPKSEASEGEPKEPEVKQETTDIEAKGGGTKDGEVKEETTEEEVKEEVKEEAKEETTEETTEESKPEEAKLEEVKQEPPPAPIPDPPHDPFKGVRADPTDTEEIPLDADGSPKPSPSRPGMPILPALGRRWVAKESDGVELLAPEKEWERRKKELGEKSAAIDQLMAMVGLEQVKSEFLAIKSTIDAAKNRRGMLRRQEFNLALTGNPGTGKKTLATIYRTLLKECAAWSSVNSPHNEKRSGFDFQADKDIENFHLVLNNYGENSKVFVFIDSIEGMTGSLRADLLYTLDRHAERLRLVVFLAGTETAMNKLLASRPSGRWQFPRRLTIKDYDDEQLRLIFLHMVRHNGFAIEGGETGPYPRIVAKRVARNRESGGFANAYDLVLAWEKILDRQAARLDQEHAVWKAAEDQRAEEWKAALETKRVRLRELLTEQQNLQAVKKSMAEALEAKKQEQEDPEEKKLASAKSTKPEEPEISESQDGGGTAVKPVEKESSTESTSSSNPPESPAAALDAAGKAIGDKGTEKSADSNTEPPTQTEGAGVPAVKTEPPTPSDSTDKQSTNSKESAEAPQDKTSDAVEDETTKKSETQKSVEPKRATNADLPESTGDGQAQPTPTLTPQGDASPTKLGEKDDSKEPTLADETLATGPEVAEKTEEGVKAEEIAESKEVVNAEEAVKPEEEGVKPEKEAVDTEVKDIEAVDEGVRPTEADVKPEQGGAKSTNEDVEPERGVTPAEKDVKLGQENVKEDQEGIKTEIEDVESDKDAVKAAKDEQPELSPEEVEIAAEIDKLKKEIKEDEEMLSSLREYKDCRAQEIKGRFSKLKQYKILPMLTSVKDDKTSAAPKSDDSEKSEKSTGSGLGGDGAEDHKEEQKSIDNKAKPSLDEKDDKPTKDEEPAKEEELTNNKTTVEAETKTQKPPEEDTKTDADNQTDKKPAEHETKAEDKKADDKSAEVDAQAKVLESLAAIPACASHDGSDKVDLSSLPCPAPKPNARFLTKEDIIGPEPEDIRHKSKAWQELEKMAGLEDVKKAIGELLNRAKANYRREVLGKEPLKTSLNQVFLGPPGTGKTTVAKLYGQILAEIGLLSTRELVFKTPADFIGQYIGESEVKTAHILDSTIGKVLIIDDAHMFYHGGRPGTTHESDEFRLSCIDVMISKIHNKPGEDRCVLLLGYPDMMEEMFQKCNPGLRRRFPLEEAFRFQSYDDKTLNEILRLKMAKEEITADEGAMEVAAEVLRRARDRPNFGNGGDVDNLLNQAKTRYRARIKAKADAEAEVEVKQAEEKPADLPKVTKVDDDEAVAGEKLAQIQVDLPTAVKAKAAEPSADTPQPEEEAPESPVPAETAPTLKDEADILTSLTNSESRIVLLREDFDPDWNRGALASAKCQSLFSDLIGFEPIISKFEGYQRLAANMRRRGKDPREIVPFTFIFKGPPGTGKTHTARIIGQIFYDMGFLSTNDVIECSASHLIGQYMGQTSPKVINLFEKALGKVLFIDEAYRLSGGNRSAGHGSYEEEAIGELVDCMTKPRYLRKMIIVLAGYDKDMDNLMQVNAGLRGRFATEIIFPTMAASKAKQHLENLLLKEDIELRDEFDPGEEEKEKVLRFLHRLGQTVGWANARDVKSLAAAVTGQVYRDVDLDKFEREEEEEEQGNGGEKKKKLLRVTTKQLNGHLKEMLRQRMKSGGLA